MSTTISYQQTYLQEYLLNEVITLQNRVVFAPMTRCAAPNAIPTKEMADYYARRGDAGLLIGEGTLIAPDAGAYPNAPGIYTHEQILGWKNITERVHQMGGRFFLQLFHAGMMSHAFYRQGMPPIAPSCVAPKRQTVPRSNGALRYGPAKAMEKADFQKVLSDFAQAAKNALAAGCDGVEIHAGAGYLLDEFLHYHTNHRMDEYGGSAANRIKFVLEVVDALARTIGSGRVGIRLSPIALPSMENMESDARDIEVFKELLKQLDQRQIAYVHVCVDDDEFSPLLGMKPSEFIRTHYNGHLIGCGGYDLESGEEALRNGKFQLIAFGRSFLANPHLIAHIKTESSKHTLKKFLPEMLQRLD